LSGSGSATAVAAVAFLMVDVDDSCSAGSSGDAEEKHAHSCSFSDAAVLLYDIEDMPMKKNKRNSIGILGPQRHNGVDRFIVDSQQPRGVHFFSFVDHDWGVTEGSVDDHSLCVDKW
jgi:hypothetical protein